MSMLVSAQAALKRASKQLSLSQKQVDELLKPDKEHQHELNVNGHKHQAYRIQHSNKRGIYKGGIRFHPEVDLDEARALALLMSIKTAAVGIPMGGGKGGVAIDPREHGIDHIEDVARAYVQALKEHIGPEQDVPAPDVNTNPALMDVMVEEYQKLTGDTTKASFTGKSLHNGGSQGRDAATGRGGMIVLREYLKTIDKKPGDVTVAVQGVGNVGYWFAKLASEELGVRIIALADSKKTIAVKNSETEQLDISNCTGYKKGWIDELKNDSTNEHRSDSVLSMEADVLVLAALGDVITDENEPKVQAEVILELANGPVQDSALLTLHERGVVTIPDVVANAGGVIVSYLEWKQNKSGEMWEESEVNNQLEEILVSASQKMFTRAKQRSIPLKDAAFQIAIEELTK